MRRGASFQTKAFFLASIIFSLFASQTAFSQCDNYFKPKYRAVGTLQNANDGIFLLDDWTGDGRLDYWNFQLNGSTSTQNIIIYPAKSTGYWDWNNPITYTTTVPGSVTTSNSSFPVVVKDFDSDGHPDLLVYGASNTIYRNNNNGTMTALTSFSYPVSYQGTVGFYDINGDQYLDWITMINVPNVGSSIGFQPGNADGSFGTRVDLASNVFLNNATKIVGDFDGDGKNDIAYNYLSSGINKLVLLKNLGGGTFDTKPPQDYTAPTGAFFSKTADFNNDGRSDIVAVVDMNSDPFIYSRTLFVLYGQSDGTFVKTEYPVHSPTDNAQIQVADMNADSQPDIVEINQKFYSIHTNNGGGNFTRKDYNRTLRESGKPIVLSDFSADGKADIIVLGNRQSNVFNELVVVVKENVCNSFGETVTQDFDGNLVGDVVYWNPNSGNWTYYNGVWGGNSGQKTVFNWGSGSHGDIPAIGDFDGDGRTDYAVYRNSTGVWYIFKSSDSSWLVFQFGLPGDIPVPGDYNGGGKTDFAVFRPDTGVWYIWTSEDQQFSAGQFGLNGDKTVPADYDGDGITDIAVWRPSTGIWYYVRSSDNSFVGLQWGISTDIAVPADYDGDGKADVAVYRNGTWYFLRSSNNSFAVIYWGTATDIPIPFYRTQYVADVVVLRPSNGILYNYYYPLQGIGFDTTQNVPIATTLPKN